MQIITLCLVMILSVLLVISRGSQEKTMFQVCDPGTTEVNVVE